MVERNAKDVLTPRSQGYRGVANDLMFEEVHGSCILTVRDFQVNLFLLPLRFRLCGFGA